MARARKSRAQDPVVKRQEIAIELSIYDYDSPLTVGDVKRWIAAVEATGATDATEIDDDAFLRYAVTVTDPVDEAS